MKKTKGNKAALGKKDRKRIKKALLKAAAKGCSDVYQIALGLTDALDKRSGLI